MECKICGYSSDPANLAKHIRKIHNLDVQEYYDKYLAKEDEGLCKICKTPTKFLGLSKGYKECCCSACTMELHYGVRNSFQLESTKKSIKKTMLTRYGAENAMQSKEIQNKAKQTNLEKYGAENVFASEYGKEKIKQTNLDKYGVENSMQAEEVKNKSRDTFEKKYGGVGWASKSIKEKAEKTNVEKYGCANPLGNRKVIEKVKDIRDQRIQKILKDYDCSILSRLGIKYTREVLEQSGVQPISLSKNYGFTFVKNSDIPLLKEIDNQFRDKEKIYNSRYEREIHEWLQSIYDEEIQVNTRKVITPLELDFYIPEKKLALEFNGDYWHSSAAGIDSNYHLNKTLACTENGIRLIHIFEYEWRLKQDIIKSIISSALGIYDNRIYARNCEIREVNAKEARLFLEENHLQSFVPSTYRIGLYYKDNLVQLLCFGQNRFKKNEIELLRMCTKQNYQVICGFSKLLKHQPYDNFVSYVDLSKYTGKGYFDNGFELISKSKPSYKYIYGDTILNRIAAQKYKLPELLGDKFDPDKTESQNMMDNDYWQVFDCGNLKLKYIR